MSNSDLKNRTKDYALSVIRLFAELPKRTETQVMGRQLLRSGTSVGAQYREATRAKSNADFIRKIEGSLQKLEESEYRWNCSVIPVCSGREIGRREKRNRRTERNLREHRPKHKSQIKKSKTLGRWWNFINLSFIPLPLSLCQGHDHVTFRTTFLSFILSPVSFFFGPRDRQGRWLARYRSLCSPRPRKGQKK
jgi:four helix bundle protein